MKRIFRQTFKFWGAALLVLAAVAPVRAQWQTQSVTLKPGWNSLSLHVDMQHTTLADLFTGTPVTEVWLWKPDLSTLQFVTSPQAPLDVNSRWLTWKKALPLQATLNTMIGNASYLIRVDENETSDFELNLKGVPVPPSFVWSSSGVNFFGFSTVETGAPFFYDFLEPVPDLRLSAELYKYIGGPIENNPEAVFNLRNERVQRGSAYWMRADGLYNRYYGPFSLSLQSQTGVEFGTDASTYRIRLKNQTAEELVVTLESLASEAPPAGEVAIEGTPEVLVRGELDIETLKHTYSRLSDGEVQWTLAPAGTEGSELEVILGLDRSAMTGADGAFYGGLLRFTDSLGFSQYDLPVNATKGSAAGLWVGDAAVTQVRHNLGFFQKEGEEVLEVDRNTEFGGVARSFKLRLIVHVSDDGTTRLLQRVFYGLDDSLDPVLTTKEGNLNVENLEVARRISSAHLPWSEGNDPWLFTGGDFAEGDTITATVTIGADDHRSNPFLHTYHPDHDNRNANFNATLPQGIESFAITRELSLAFSVPTDDFDALTAGGIDYMGDYLESITIDGDGVNSEEYEVKGPFLLTRIANIGTLLTELPVVPDETEATE